MLFPILNKSVGRYKRDDYDQSFASFLSVITEQWL